MRLSYFILELGLRSCLGLLSVLFPSLPKSELSIAHGICGLIGLLLLALGNAILPIAVAAQDLSQLRLGTNLHEVVDYSPQTPFRNIFLYSREWFTQCVVGRDPGCTNQNSFDTGEASAIDIDPDGWVRSLPPPSAPGIFTSVATFWDLPSEFPSGRYIVRYDGAGSIEYALGAEKDPALSTTGRDVISVDISRGGILLRIAATDPALVGDHIRNIRVLSESDDQEAGGTRFNSDFIERLQPFQVLRFMDWMRTNNSAIESWSERSKPTDARYSTDRGVPVEVMLELSNATGKSPWFTIPARANDEYVQSFAQLVRDTLNQSLIVLVEYSNEIWNPTFSQGDWVEQQGLAEFAASEGSAFTKRINWHGKRTAEICAIWKQVFAARSETVVCVLGSQAANSWTASEALRCPLWSQGPCQPYGISAIGIAPYFGDYLGSPEFETQLQSWAGSGSVGRDLLFQELFQGGALSGGPIGGALAQSFGWITENKQVATEFGVSLISYEGGQHLVGVGAARENAEITELFTAVNRDPRMGEIYSSYLAGWRERVPSLFMHFTDIGSYSKFGSWGGLEKIGERNSPKHDALVLFGGGVVTTPTPAPPTPTAIPAHTLAIRIKGRGRVIEPVQGLRCSGSCRFSIQHGRSLELRVSPARGQIFRRWRGGCNHTRTKCRIVVGGARSVTAEFSARR